MSIPNKSYTLVNGDELDADAPKVLPLPRNVAEELVLPAVLSPLIATNLAAQMDDVIYSTDSSDKIGAIVKRPARVEIGRALWRTGRRKGGYAAMRVCSLVKRL